MLVDANRTSFSRFFAAPAAPAAALALLLTASAPGKGPDRLGPRDDWNALPCEMQRIAHPEGGYYFGYGVAIDGDLAVAYGSSNHRLYLYRFDGAQWQQEAILTADEDMIVSEVAVSGDVIVVGVANDDELGDHAGATYVFRHDGTEWVQEVKLFASDPGAWDRFGYSVAIEGNMLVIGATEWNTPYWEGPGSAYVFEHLGDAWIEQAKLTASDGQEDDRFGSNVAIEGDTIIVVAYGAEAFYSFRCIDESWVERQKINPPDGPSYAGFRRVGLCGDLLVAGRNQDDDLGSSSGSALVYQRVDEAWTLQQKLLEPGGCEDHSFGWDVAIDGETILIAALGEDEQGPVAESVWVFRPFEAVWQAVVELEGAWGEGFAMSVGMDGDRSIVGAPFSNDDGAIYLFAGMTGVDCNSNGVADGCDIFLGTSEDLNENGIPDECECPADFDDDGDVDTADLLFLLGAWGTPNGDVDFDGDTDTADLLALLAAWGECS